jgi:hypothetical protein
MVKTKQKLKLQYNLIFQNNFPIYFNWKLHVFSTITKQEKFHLAITILP